MTGTVKFFLADKKYGFITSPEIEGDVFVHYTAINGRSFRELKVGEVVEFEIAPDKGKGRGRQAANVRRSLQAAREACQQ